jgi:hypothetical protein
MAEIKQTHDELLLQLTEQLHFLINDCKNFDSGDVTIAKRIAVILRVLLHDTNTSISLLGQLNLKKACFYSTTKGVDVANILTQASLLILKVGNGVSKYEVPFDNRPPHQFSWMSFDDWWNQNVFLDNKRRIISRKKLITYVANQDGGAHVDPELDEVYYDLSRKNSITWLDTFNNPLGPNPVLLSIRQIAYEVITTLKHTGIDMP